MLRPTCVLTATPAARTSISPTHPSPATRQIVKLEPTKKHDAVVYPDPSSLYRGIAQPTVDPVTTSYHLNVPRLLQLPPPIQAKHQASRLYCSGLHEPSPCRQEM